MRVDEVDDDSGGGWVAAVLAEKWEIWFYTHSQDT
jgi:hypothetical protein